jgi:hypothetical protein
MTGTGGEEEDELWWYEGYRGQIQGVASRRNQTPGKGGHGETISLPTKSMSTSTSTDKQLPQLCLF